MNGYSQNAVSGTYHFVAELASGYIITSSLKPEIRVYVGETDSKTSVLFKDTNSECVEIMQMFAKGNDVNRYLNGIKTDNMYDAYYVIYNNNPGDKSVILNFYYFDEKGQIIPLTQQTWVSETIVSEAFGVTARETLVGIEYEKCIVEVTTYWSDIQTDNPIRVVESYWNADEKGVVAGINVREYTTATDYKANCLLIDGQNNPLAIWEVNTGILDGGISSAASITERIYTGSGNDNGLKYYIYESGGYEKNEKTEKTENNEDTEKNENIQVY